MSWMAVYNEMLARRPDLVDVLRQPFAWDRNDEQSPGEDPFFSLPVIFDIAGVPRIFFVGWYIRDAQRHEHAPRLSEPQLEALELLWLAAHAFASVEETLRGGIPARQDAS